MDCSCDELTTNSKEHTEALLLLQGYVFGLSKKNLEASIESTINLLDLYPYSFNLVVCELVYSSFVSQKKDFGIYLNFLQELERKETNKSKHNIFEIFSNFLLGLKSQESCFLLEKLIEQGHAEPKILKCKKHLG